MATRIMLSWKNDWTFGVITHSYIIVDNNLDRF